MSSETTKILVVDDDPALRDLLGRYLREQGFDVALVGDAPAMDRYLQEQKPELIVLDLMLPGEDGLSIAKRLRSDAGPPIIMLSARGEDIDRIVGLEVGADDYLAKPFNPRELLARIRAVLRRGREPAKESTSTMRFGPYRLDTARRRLFRGSEPVALTSGEYALLEAFVQHPNRVLSRDQLVDLLKGYERSPFDRSVDVRVTRLRRKIEPDPSRPAYITTVWGEGYLFSPQGPEVGS